LPLICLSKAERRNEKGRPGSSKTLYWRLRLDSLFSKAVVKLRVSSLKHGYDLFMAVEAHEREFEEGVGSHIVKRADRGGKIYAARGFLKYTFREDVCISI